MSSESAIRLSNVSKCYHTYRRPLDRLVQSFSKKRRLYEEFWALQDVDLDVHKGETVGIVGQNGSGKSTLLQLVVGTLTATAGEVRTRGRISAILELGAGFNPEFSGVENARLNAAIIGMSNEEIEQRMPDILSFSELGNFIDKKVKTYSSGMYIRLAFSVVINMSPDILVIDEALAVGDSRFQRKCFRKLDELRNAGTTILFVTHATDTVITHCDRAVFLEEGRVASIGEPNGVVNNYMESMFRPGRKNTEAAAVPPDVMPDLDDRTLNADPSVDACRLRPSYNDTEYEWGSGDARIIDFLLFDDRGYPLGASVESGQQVSILCAVHFHKAQENIIYGLTIKTVDGTTVFGTNTDRLRVQVDRVDEGETIYLRFDVGMLIISGEYFFSVGVVSRGVDGDDAVLHRRYDLFRLKIRDEHRAFGYAALPTDVRIGKDQAGIDRC